MTLISQKLANLLGGISKQGSAERFPNQAEDQTNCWSVITEGLERRPSMDHQSELFNAEDTAPTVAQLDTAFIHVINRDVNERYEVVVSSSGSIEVFSSGTTQTVYRPEVSSYLVQADANIDIRAVTIGDYTFIVNRDTVVANTTETATAQVFEALIFVKLSDFGTLYTVLINGTATGIRTLAAEDPSGRPAIDTTEIAGDLFSALVSQQPNFTFTQIGPVIHVKKTDGTDFRIEGRAGLDESLKVIKDKTQHFTDLPLIGTEGFTVEIEKSKDTQQDNYFMRFEARGTSDERAGVWIETAKPGELIALDSSTMPHVLVREGAIIETIQCDQGTPDDTLITPPTVNSTYVSGFTSQQSTSSPGTTFALSAFALSSIASTRVFFPISESSLQGTYTSVDLYFDAQPSCLGGWTGQILVGWNDGTVDNYSTFQIYSSEVSPANDQRLSIEPRTWSTLDNLFLECRVSSGFAVLAATNMRCNTHSSNDTLKGVEIPLGVDVKIDFQSTNFYITGTSITARITSTGVQSSAVIDLTSDETGTAVATLMQVQLDLITNITATDNGDGTVTLVDSAGTPTVDLLQTGHNENIHLITTDLGIDSGFDLGSRKIVNLTDDSSATITSNTSRTITLSGNLAGGTDNKFQEDDEVHVIGEGTGYFTFRPAVWKKRAVGTLQEGKVREADQTRKRGTNPFPSFVGNTIRDIFYYQGRLGVVSDENVVLTASGRLFDFFRRTIQDLVDDDPIDVQGTTPDVAVFQAVTQWNKQLWLWSEQSQQILSGSPLLTPKTVRLDLVGRYEVTPRVRPWVSGDHQYFCTRRPGFTEIMEYYQKPESDEFAARSITRHVQGLIAGNPLQIVGSAEYNMLAVLANTDQRNVYVYQWERAPNGQILQGAWHRWRFNPNAKILGMFFQDEKFGVINKQTDGVFLDTMSIDPADSDSGSSDRLTHLDRRATQDATGFSVNFNSGVAGETQWILPFDIATDGTEGTLVVRQRSNGDTIPTATRTATSTIFTDNGTDYSAVAAYLGLIYDSQQDLSQLHVRSDDGQGPGRTDGRLTIRNLEIAYEDTLNLDVEVNPDNSTLLVTYAVDASQPGETGQIVVPVMSRSSEVTIVLKSTGSLPFSVHSARWEGMFNTRGRDV